MMTFSAFFQPQNNTTASQVLRFRDREDNRTLIFLSQIQLQQLQKKIQVSVKAAQHHPHTSHSSLQHLQRASVVVTPREAGRGFSVREVPAGGAEGRSAMTEAGV